MATTGLATLLLALGASSAFASAPEATTLGVSDIGAHGATLHGKILLDDDGAWAGFVYGPTADHGSESELTNIDASSGWVEVSTTISGLEAGTTYHYEFGAATNSGTVLGGDAVFTTSQPTLTAAKYPADLSAEAAGEPALEVGLENGSLTCDSVTASGQFAAASGSVSLTPSYAGCSLLGIEEANVAMNGCHFDLHAGPATETSGSLDIVCPEGQTITAKAATCAVSIPAQTGLGADLTPTGSSPGRLGVELHGGGVTYTKTKDGFFCDFVGTGTKTDGTIGGRMAVAGANGGKAVDLSLLPQLTFQADEYPADLAGEQLEADPLTISVENGSLKCESVTVSAALAIGAEAALAVTPSYSGCTLLGQSATVATNGCQYALHPGSGFSGGETTGTMDVVCPPGKVITVTAATCAMSIPAQSGLSDLHIGNVGSEPQTFGVSPSAGGVEYTKTKDGFFCNFVGTGTKTDGAYNGSMIISAANLAEEAIGTWVS